MRVHLAALADHCHVWAAVRVILLAIVSRKLILVLKEGVLVLLRVARAGRHVAGDLVALPTGTTFAGRVNLVEFGTTRVHMARPRVLVHAAVRHGVRQGVLPSDYASTPLLSLSLDGLCLIVRENSKQNNRTLTFVWQRELVHSSHVHLELALIGE